MSLEKDIAAVVSSTGLVLYDTAVVNENDQTIYRISVVSDEVVDGKRKGVSLDECVSLTHLISPLLDVTPPVSGEYRLEVGSPGIERKLATLAHFQKSVGENVSLSTTNKEKFRGLLKSVEGNTIVIEDEDGEHTLSYGDVSKAKTYFEW